jgi:putative glutamine amidotransferase
MGADVLVLPVLHDLNLNVPQGKEFRKKIINMFDAQVILGGADIDPYLYGEATTYARGIIRKRDVSELKFVRQFIEAEKGMNFGICRGHQMCAVANHKKLIQDIQMEVAAPELHLNGTHPILVDNKNPVFSVFDKTKVLVNSFHHQAIAVSQSDKEYKITALSLDSPAIIEAIEFRNGLGHTFQFHPELMHDQTGDKILRQFVKLTTKNKTLKGNDSCLNLFNSLIAN